MKPAWDQLGDAFKDSKTVVIGDVDCTVHQGLCSEHGVKGYPTVKYYVNGEWSDYEGGRDYDALKEFADENLGPSCTYPDNEDLCSEEQLTFMKEWHAKPEELKAEIKQHEDAIKKLNDDFDEALKELQATYEKNQEDRDSGIKEHKKPLGMLKSIKLGGEKSDL
jgi:thioredoxin-like negative regulator of GroEL